MTIEELYRATDGFRDLRLHLDAFIEQHTLSRAFARESVEGMADAKEVIAAAFEDLHTKFGPKEEVRERAVQSPR